MGQYLTACPNTKYKLLADCLIEYYYEGKEACVGKCAAPTLPGDRVVPCAPGANSTYADQFLASAEEGKTYFLSFFYH
jgi:hypothetical protein